MDADGFGKANEKLAEMRNIFAEYERQLAMLNVKIETGRRLNKLCDVVTEGIADNAEEMLASTTDDITVLKLEEQRKSCELVIKREVIKELSEVLDDCNKLQAEIKVLLDVIVSVIDEVCEDLLEDGAPSSVIAPFRKILLRVNSLSMSKSINEEVSEDEMQNLMREMETFLSERGDD